ncbi:LacI family DNA-binding transcriptional regulator [Hymenobacter amundsenii]|uniref:LacI family DNA-binding transcriptional regulator n=1 Tax=Hymenobacter amundsenii TaxID=2006685 RepID=UPI0013FDF2A4|nr:LacI family DNA-binding transcriptional regulator [Hymenobacter amundsenii]
MAQELNITIATVSRALQDSYEVSIQTKERAQPLATRLNYQVNAYASSLGRNISKTIDLLPT